MSRVYLFNCNRLITDELIYYFITINYINKHINFKYTGCIHSVQLG